MKYFGLLILSLLFLFPTPGICQSSTFQNGDRIIFIGSSIVMNGGNYHYLNLFYATRYPQQEIVFLNGGIGGDLSDDIINRMGSDILAQKPTWAVIMLEENDLHRGFYFEERQNEADVDKKKHEAVLNWYRNADSLVRILTDNKVKVILQTPTIYDQTGDFSEKISYGLNDTLQQCARYLFTLSKKYKVPVVDCWTILNNLNQVLQQKSLKYSIIGEDRRHVGSYGNFAMAYQFLKTIPVNPFVSKTVVEVRRNKVREQINGKVDSLRTGRSTISFNHLSKSLPFPAPDGINVDSLFSFSDEMNADILCIHGLKRGSYQLKIDQNNIAIFSNQDLENGINLSRFKNTPQYLQAGNLLSFFEKFWSLEYDLRMLAYVQYKYINHFEHHATLNEVQNTFEKILKETKDVRTHKKLKELFSTYLTHKPKEKDMISTSATLLQTIRQLSVPVGHSYSIERLAD
ncbi:MAG: SGNH/GDSL hydrolase family protein [Chitinophagaceae bacterium]|nr:SGNH/GDSL hydrolase family protein [Chitinophagaceae bacterium]